VHALPDETAMFLSAIRLLSPSTPAKLMFTLPGYRISGSPFMVTCVSFDSMPSIKRFERNVTHSWSLESVERECYRGSVR
jgi:hypothetical protein